MRPLQNISGEIAVLEAYNMKTRIIVSVILLPLLLIVLLAMPKVCTAILFGIMAAVAAYEMLFRTGLVKHIRMVSYTCVAAFLVSLWGYIGMESAWMKVTVLLFVVVLFVEMMLSHIKLRFEKVAYCLVAGLAVPYLLTAVVRILAVEGTGRYFVLIPFILAFLSDSGAYFAGKFLGKHKLAPVISPNKTIEGVIGGVLGAILGMLIYGLILQVAFQFTVDYGCAILYGILGSLAGVFGDLSFSVIKRQTGIKDYGFLIPGHGGILDRFDSMVIVAPLTELLLALLPIAVK